MINDEIGELNLKARRGYIVLTISPGTGCRIADFTLHPRVIRSDRRNTQSGLEYWSKAKPYLFRNGLYPHCFRLVGAPNFDRIFSNIKNDMENAGDTWTDEPAFRDGNLVWGRMVADIPDYYRELIKALSA